MKTTLLIWNLAFFVFFLSALFVWIGTQGPEEADTFKIIMTVSFILFALGAIANAFFSFGAKSTRKDDD